MTFPLTATFFGLAVIGLCGYSFLRWLIATRSLRIDAAEEYASLQKSGSSTINGVSETEFTAIYVKSYQPRWALYVSGALGCIILASPLMLLIISSIYREIWRFNGSPEWGGTIGYVYMFAIAFGVAFLSAAIAAVFARLFHHRAPEPFRHALARARGEPLPEETTWRRRPKWARHIKRPSERAKDQA